MGGIEREKKGCIAGRFTTRAQALRSGTERKVAH